MKKRFLAIFAATAVAAGSLCFAGCSKDTEPAASETYKGVISAQTFASPEEAAANYIAAEISGDDYQVSYSSYSKDADLTESEIEELNVSSEINGTIESVEKGKIYFTEVSSASAVSAAAREINLYVTVYIIKYTPEGTTISTYKYIIPLPETDEVLSYSYYNSVMNPENFKNCTATMTTTTSIEALGKSRSSTSKQTMQITESAVKVSMSVPVDENGRTVNADVYIVDTLSGVKCAVEAEGQCVAMSVSDLGFKIGSISELYSSKLNEAQYSLFLKTDYGFKMREEALNGIVESVFDAIFSELDLPGVSLDWTLGTASADYKVVDGKLYKATTDMSVDLSAWSSTESVSMYLSSKAELVYSNYGTTTVTISDRAKSVLGLN